MKNKIQFFLGKELKEIEFSATSTYSPTTTILKYLRSLPHRKGIKEGCGEGDCGACTIVIANLNPDNQLVYKAFDSCLIFLPALHGKQLITVEDLKINDNLHPIQKAMLEADASQCGFCTPGFVMSLFALYKSKKAATDEQILDAITGNLCRCTGYRPIIEAARKVMNNTDSDHFTQNENFIIEQLKKIASQTNFKIFENAEQKYFLPLKLKDALEVKKDYRKALLIAGSTDVALRVSKKNELLPEILDISEVPNLQYIKKSEKEIKIGAGTTLEEIRQSIKTELPELYNILSVFGSLQIRNRATIGGSLGSASPIGDSIPVLMAYDASVKVENVSNYNYIKVRDFIVGYRKTKLHEDELISEIQIPHCPNNTIIKSYKISKRKDLDISTVSGSFRLKLSENKTVEEIKLFYGGMAAQTMQAAKTQEFLTGKTWTEENVTQAMKIIEHDFTPISDARSSADGRLLMAANLILKFWNETN